MKLAILACLIALPAFAADAPKPATVDMTTVLSDENDKPIKDEFEAVHSLNPVTHLDVSDCSKCPPLTLGMAVLHVLQNVLPDEKTTWDGKEITWEIKWAWARYGDKIHNESAATLSAGQAGLIASRLGKFYGGVVLMRAMPLIDPNREVPEIK